MPRDSESTKTDRQLVEETAARARRIETRVTLIANHLGIEAGGGKPELRGESLYVPSLKVSLQDVLDAIEDTTRPISVYCGNDYLVTVER